MDDDFVNYGTPPPEERIIREHNLTAEQLKDLSEAFSLYDIDHLGVISMKLLPAVMHIVGHNPPEHELNDYIAELDPNGTDELYLSDYLYVMSERYKDMTVEDEVILAFKVFDRMNKGYIHETEFRGIMTTFGDPMDDDDIDQILLDANSNTEGNIVYREFVAMMMER